MERGGRESVAVDCGACWGVLDLKIVKTGKCIDLDSRVVFRLYIKHKMEHLTLAWKVRS